MNADSPTETHAPTHHVLIIGIGAVGSAVAIKLGHFGLRLRLIDKGVLGPNNLDWQLSPQDLGQPKASLADRIRLRVPGSEAQGFVTDITTLDTVTLQEHLMWADVVVAATDDPDAQAVVNRECLYADTPVVFPGIWIDHLSGISEAGEVLWFDPRYDRMPCYECLTHFRDLPGDAQPGRGGEANVEAIVQATVTVVQAMLEPAAPNARFLDAKCNLIKVRGFGPLRPTLRRDFRPDEFVVHQEIRFPARSCPACGRSASPDEPPPDTTSVEEPQPGVTSPHERSVPPMGEARNAPVDQDADHLPVDRRAAITSVVTVALIISSLLIWAVIYALNRNHSSAAAAPSGPISPTVKLVCDPHVGGTWCEDGASGSAGTIALDIVGVSYDNFYNLCGMGYKFDLTDNYGQSSGVTGNGCGGYGDVYSTSANPVTGAPYIDLKLPKYSNTDNYRCWSWTLTLRIKDPSGHTVRTASYGTNLGNCSASLSPSTGATSAPSTRTKPASVRVPADAEGGVITGIYARKGDTVVITGTGSAGYGYDGTEGCVGNPTTHPDGSRYLGSFNCGPKDDPEAVLSGAAIGQLIARIDGGAWFGVGTRTTVTAGGSGYIYLAYNDSAYSDNTGSYSATITINGPGPVASP